MIPPPTVRLAMPGNLNCYTHAALSWGKPVSDPQSPVGRLAFANGQAERPGNGTFDAPSVRLAINGKGQGETNGALMDPPSVRLAITADGGTKPQKTADALAAGDRPALLVSYVYLEAVPEEPSPLPLPRLGDGLRGVFRPQQRAAVIDLQQYIDCCKRLMAEDPTLTEVFSLDVIGDWKASA
jgi:hypothetical protein